MRTITLSTWHTIKTDQSKPHIPVHCLVFQPEQIVNRPLHGSNIPQRNPIVDKILEFWTEQKPICTTGEKMFSARKGYFIQQLHASGLHPHSNYFSRAVPAKNVSDDVRKLRLSIFQVLSLPSFVRTMHSSLVFVHSPSIQQTPQLALMKLRTNNVIV